MVHSPQPNGLHIPALTNFQFSPPESISLPPVHLHAPGHFKCSYPQLTLSPASTTEGSGLPITQAASANQNVTNNLPHKKGQRVTALSEHQNHKLKHSDREKKTLHIPNQNLQNKSFTDDLWCIQNVLHSPEHWTQTQIVMHLQLTQYKKTVIKLKAGGTVVATRKWGLELSSCTGNCALGQNCGRKLVRQQLWEVGLRALHRSLHEHPAYLPCATSPASGWSHGRELAGQ